jgi:hypothetical protein
MKHRIARLALIAVLLVSAGCSTTNFLYNRLHLIIPWYLDDYVELDRTQRDNLDELLDPFLTWHRREELPHYVELLDGMMASLDQPATADSLAVQSARIEQAWYRLEARAVEWLLTLGEQLSDEQIGDFIAQLRKDQEKYEKKYLSRDEEEYREEVYDNFVDNAQDYLGRLSREQKARASDTLAGMIRADDLWLQERASWIDRLEQTLERQPGWQDRIRAELGERDTAANPEYDRIIEQNLEVVHQALADLLNSLSERQDARLRRELVDLRDDLNTLIEQGG